MVLEMSGKRKSKGSKMLDTKKQPVREFKEEKTYLLGAQSACLWENRLANRLFD